MAKFTTMSQLSSFLTNKANIALDRTTERILDKLEEFIENEVYSNNQSWYTRTNEVKNNWEKTKAQIIGSVCHSEISFSKPISHSGGDLWQHGISFIDNETLLNILVGNYNTGTIANFDNPNPRNFWNPFLQWCEQNFDRIFKEEFNKI